MTPLEREEAALAREMTVTDTLAKHTFRNSEQEQAALKVAIAKTLRAVLRERPPFLRPTILVSIDGGLESGLLSLRAHLRVSETRVSERDAKVIQFPRKRKRGAT